MAKRYDPIMCMMVDEPTKARDVAPATQRYINTIVDESKANAEKFVRQAEQDDEVPENELKYVYKAYNEKFGYKFHDSASALDKAIKTCDAVDVDRISNYLWLWVEGREVVSMLFSEGLDKYSGPHDPEHKDEAYDFAKKYAQKELDALYSKLKSSVEKKLKEGYTNIKNAISRAK